jgi:hypothetical protein
MAPHSQALVKLGKGSRSHGEGHTQIGKTPMHARIYTRDPIGRAGRLSDNSMLPHSRRAQSSRDYLAPCSSRNGAHMHTQRRAGRVEQRARAGTPVGRGRYDLTT